MSSVPLFSSKNYLDEPMTILTAKVAQVKFPVEESFIEGLRDEEGQFLIGVSQVCRLFSVPLKNASRDFKSLLGKDVPFLSRKTPLNSKPIVAIPIKYLEPLIFEIALKGNTSAIQCMRGLANLSIVQLFHDAFDLEFGVESRKAHLDEWRLARKGLRDVLLQPLADICLGKFMII